MPERHSYDPGAFCWAGLATSDPAAASVFYAAVFTWEAVERSAPAAGRYTLLARDGKEVAILYRQTAAARAAQTPPHWTSYIAVDDVDVTSVRAAELGGQAVFRAPFDVLGEGRVAAIRDPSGAIVSLWQAQSRAGAALMDTVGALCWNELVTPDVGRAASFYERLLGWSYAAADGYTTVRVGGRPNGGIRAPTDDERREEPRWLPYFMVESVDAAVRAAEAAGGRTLSPPRPSAIGRQCLVSDPQGAAFGLLDHPVRVDERSET